MSTFTFHFRPSFFAVRMGLLAALSILVAIGAQQSSLAWAQGTNKKSAQESAAVQPPANMHLYLLVGQSNMAGRGRVSKADREPIPRVLMLTKDLKWKPAIAPLHFDKPPVVGVGVGRTFAKEMLKGQPDVVIGLIPAAAGGSPIDSWKPGGYHRQTKSHPYDDAIKRAKAALKSGQLKGILWHQGESDSKPGLAESYDKKLHELVARFRTDLGVADAPFVAGQMGQFKERPWSEAKKLVDRAQQQLPKAVKGTAFVKSNGLTHKGDQVHFNAKSYRELGRRYANAMKTLQKSSKDKTEQR